MPQHKWMYSHAHEHLSAWPWPVRDREAFGPDSTMTSITSTCWTETPYKTSTSTYSPPIYSLYSILRFGASTCCNSEPSWVELASYGKLILNDKWHNLMQFKCNFHDRPKWQAKPNCCLLLGLLKTAEDKLGGIHAVDVTHLMVGGIWFHNVLPESITDLCKRPAVEELP